MISALFSDVLKTKIVSIPAADEVQLAPPARLVVGPTPQQLAQEILQTATHYLSRNEIKEAIFGLRLELWQLEENFDPAIFGAIKERVNHIFKALPEFAKHHHVPEKRLFINSIELLELGLSIAERYRQMDTVLLFGGKVIKMNEDFATEITEEEKTHNSQATIDRFKQDYSNLPRYKHSLNIGLSLYRQTPIPNTQKDVSESSALIQYVHTFCTPSLNLEDYITPETAPAIGRAYRELALTLSERQGHSEKYWILLNQLSVRYQKFKHDIKQVNINAANTDDPRQREKYQQIIAKYNTAISAIYNELCQGYLKLPSNAVPLWIQRRNKIKEIRVQTRLPRTEEAYPAQPTIFFQALIQDIWNDCIAELGHQPCKWAFLALGSMSQFMMTPYSDIEYAVLIEEDIPRNRTYFQAVNALFKLKMTLFGETPFMDKQGFVSGRAGFRIDAGAPNEDGVIIGTTTAVLGHVANNPQDFHMFFHHRFLFGDDVLHGQLQLPALPRDEILQSLANDYETLKPKIESFETSRSIDLKSWQKLLEYSIQAMTDFEHIQQRDIFKCLNSISEQAIPSVIKSRIREALLFIYYLRCKVQLHNHAQVDKAFPFGAISNQTTNPTGAYQLDEEEQYLLKDTYTQVIQVLLQQGAVQHFNQDLWIQTWLQQAQHFDCVGTTSLRKSLAHISHILDIDPSHFNATVLKDRLTHQLKIRQLSTPINTTIAQFHGLFTDAAISIKLCPDGLTICNDYPGLGNHIVINSGDLHIKVDPEYPVVEYAVCRFFKNLFGHGAPYSEIGMMQYPDEFGSSHEKTVLISETVSGVLLTEALNSDPSLKRINQVQLQELIIAMMLVDQEDGKPGNFIITPENTVVCFDNDHAFCSEQIQLTHDSTQQELLQGEKVQVAIKNILFCLDQMTEPINHRVVQKMAELDPYSLLRNWILEQCELDELITTFPNDDGCNGFINMFERYIQSNGRVGTPTRLFLKPGYLTGLYDRLERLKHRCSDQSKPAPTLIELFKLVAPVVAKFYEWELQNKVAPYQRFKRIENGQYVRAVQQEFNVTGHELSRLNTRESLRSKLGIVFDQRLSLSDAILQQKVATIPVIVEELLSISFRSEQIGQILDDIKSGDLGSWLNLGGIPHLQEMLLSNLEWDQVPESRLLSQLKSRPNDLQELTFRNSQLTDDTLSAILKNSPNLVSLHLIGCLQLTGGFVDTLSQLPYLEKVVIVKSNIEKFSNDFRFPGLQEKGNGFRRLQSAYLGECPKLAKISLVKCPYLLHLTALETPLLKKEAITLTGSQRVTLSTADQPVRDQKLITDARIRQLLGPNLTDATDLARLIPSNVLAPIPPSTIPPFPNGLETFLASPCKLLEGKGLKYGFPTNDPLAKDTHTVFLLPPLSICDWQRILDDKTHNSPHKEAKFYSSEYSGTRWFTQPDEQHRWSNQKPTQPQWIIMPKMFIPDSYSKTFQDQQRMIPTGYTLPTATQLTAQICLHFLQTGEKLYGDTYRKYTKDSQYLTWARTSDTATSGDRVRVGAFGSVGLFVCDYWVGSADGSLGLAARAGLEMLLGH